MSTVVVASKMPPDGLRPVPVIRDKMSPILLPQLPDAVAEEAIIRLWLCVAVLDLEAPRLTVGPSGAGSLQLTLLADDTPKAICAFRAWARRYAISQAVVRDQSVCKGRRVRGDDFRIPVAPWSRKILRPVNRYRRRGPARPAGSGCTCAP